MGNEPSGVIADDADETVADAVGETAEGTEDALTCCSWPTQPRLLAISHPTGPRFGKGFQEGTKSRATNSQQQFTRILVVQMRADVDNVTFHS